MMTSALLIVVDQGGLRAYSIQETQAHGPQLKLVQAFDIPNLNDLSKTRHAVSRTSRPELDAERTERICKQLADEIMRTVNRTAAEGWSLAAPKSIHRKLVERLSSDIRERMVEDVAADLCKTPVATLPDHFRSLQPS